MPYKLSRKGEQLLLFRSKEPKMGGSIDAAVARLNFLHLTDLHQKALIYLDEHRDEGFIESSEIASRYELAPQAMRGPLHSLFLRGLVDKGT